MKGSSKAPSLTLVTAMTSCAASLPGQGSNAQRRESLHPGPHRLDVVDASRIDSPGGTRHGKLPRKIGLVITRGVLEQTAESRSLCREGTEKNTARHDIPINSAPDRVKRAVRQVAFGQGDALIADEKEALRCEGARPLDIPQALLGARGVEPGPEPWRWQGHEVGGDLGWNAGSGAGYGSPGSGAAR